MLLGGNITFNVARVTNQPCSNKGQTYQYQLLLFLLLMSANILNNIKSPAGEMYQQGYWNYE